MPGRKRLHDWFIYRKWSNDLLVPISWLPVRLKEVTWLICSNQLAPWSDWKRSCDWFVPIGWLPVQTERGHLIDLIQLDGSLVRLKEVMWLICSNQMAQLFRLKEVRWLTLSNQMAPWSDWKRSRDWLYPIRWLPGQTERGHVIDLIQSDGSLVYQTLDFYWWSRVYESLKYWRT